MYDIYGEADLLGTGNIWTGRAKTCGFKITPDMHGFTAALMCKCDLRLKATRFNLDSWKLAVVDAFQCSALASLICISLQVLG